MKMTFFLLTLVLSLSMQLVFSSGALAQFNLFGIGSSSQNMSAEEREKLIRQKIKLKTYPGGFEEEPLRVQAQTNTVVRKMAPVQEISEEPESESEEPAAVQD